MLGSLRAPSAPCSAHPWSCRQVDNIPIHHWLRSPSAERDFPSRVHHSVFVNLSVGSELNGFYERCSEHGVENNKRKSEQNGLVRSRIRS